MLQPARALHQGRYIEHAAGGGVCGEQGVEGAAGGEAGGGGGGSGEVQVVGVGAGCTPGRVGGEGVEGHGTDRKGS